MSVTASQAPGRGTVLVNLATLTPTMQDALRGLVAEITEHDGISPIN